MLRERSVPFDLRAERATLGAILMDRDAIVTVADTLQPADFYLEKHALIYGAMLACLARREPPDLATVASELRRTDQLDLVGGIAELGDIALEVPTAVHVEYYAQSVIQASTRRRLIVAGGEIAALGYDECADLDSTLDTAEQTLFRVSQRDTRNADTADMVAALGELWTHIGQLQTGDIEPGLSMGWPDLDALMVLEPGDLYYLAARPGVGKTAMMLNIAGQVARRGHHVGIYSLEMSRLQLMQRFAAMESGIDAGRVKRGELSEHELSVLQDTIGGMSTWPITTTDRGDLTGLGLRAHARRLHARQPLSLILLDYLQLVVPQRAENRQVAVSEISAGLKRLAKELRIPVIALSQLSREVEGRAAKVPQLSDLRESGSLEQDASGVLMLYRPELYGDVANAGVMEVHAVKNRHGRLGSAVLRFDAQSQRIDSVDRYRAVEGY